MPLRILLADENLAVQKLVDTTLSQEDVEVTITDNGLSALDIAIKHRPDLILADYKMAGMDIFSFVKQAKKREDIAGIPIVLLVNSNETHDPIYLQSLGVETFLKKPIDTQELTERIKTLSLLAEPLEDNSGETPKHSDLSQHFKSADDDSQMIADLLGWSTPEDRTPAAASDSQSQTDVYDTSQLDPATQENDFSLPGGQEEDSEIPETSEAPASDNFPFETTALDAGEGEAESETDNDLLQPPVFGEAIIIPQENDDLLTPPQENEAASQPFSFEANDPFEQTEQIDSEEADLLSSPPLDEPFDDAPVFSESEQNSPLAINEAEVEKEDLEPVVETPSPSSLEDVQPTLEEAGPVGNAALNNEQIRKMVQETAERIAKEMLPALVKSSLSQEMVSPIIEGVAWELMPPLAESEIKKEIKRLQPEKETS